MRLLLAVAALALFGFLSVQLFNLQRDNRELGARLESANIEIGELELENAKLQADIGYFADPENLAKELKARFDYKKPGEKLIKIQ